jgi:hypothetical protein
VEEATNMSEFPFVHEALLQERFANKVRCNVCERRCLLVDGGLMYLAGTFYYMTFVSSEMTVQVPVEHQQIPPGELAVQRGTRVEATDGFVGKVNEFVVNPENGHITHMLMQEGHLWGQKDVIIPLSAMGEPHEDTVFLKIDKHQIESLPTFPVHRRWS